MNRDASSADEYAAFIANKTRVTIPTGLPTVPALNPALFPFQRDCVAWALRRGRAALFQDCGLGKAIQALEWARCVCDHTGGDVIIATPLAVTRQMAAEAVKFNIAAPVAVSRDGTVARGITITNYESLHKFDLSRFAGVVCDEAGILKSYDGATRKFITESFARTPFKLSCTATPAPNDHVELGNQAEFLGVMSRVEMLATYFCHDSGETSVWRLKGHAVADFWRWVASWAVMLRSPADLGYESGGFDLPPLNIIEHVLPSGIVAEGQLFSLPAQSLDEQRKARRQTMDQRVAQVAALVNGDTSGDPWLVWCELNDEGDALTRAINGAVQVAGADDDDVKADRIMAFAEGRTRALITKAKIASQGLNLQVCHKQAYVGLSHSYEQFYQAVRRSWRFGQTHPVDVHVVTTDVESAVLENIKRKQAAHAEMAAQMVGYMADVMNENLKGGVRTEDSYTASATSGDGWVMNLGDCVESIREMPDDSVHFTVFSPPFASLYTYSASARDMGNCRTHAEFYGQFKFLVADLLRVTMPGRLLSFHCMNLPTLKERDGVIGITDFRGDLIRMFREAGWIYHSEVCIWKDPVTAMQRTKALGLLHKQIKKDSCMSRQGIADYLVTMRKPGDNPQRVTHTPEDFPVDLWQRYASPVWMDINPSDVLQYQSAREEKDERHLCPLQLDVIRRALKLWSNPGDVVLSPFAGIGSEGHVAIQEGRRFIGCELKRSYFEQACRNLRAAVQNRQQDLFAGQSE